MLGGFGLQLTRTLNPGHQGEMHKCTIAFRKSQAHLAGCFQERERLNITDGAANLANGNIGMAIMTGFSTLFHKGLYLIGNVGNHLNGLTQILTTALFANHRLINLAGGEVIALAHLGADKAFVMTQIEIGLSTVFGHEYFSVLKRTHCSRINVDIGI